MQGEDTRWIAGIGNPLALDLDHGARVEGGGQTDRWDAIRAVSARARAGKRVGDELAVLRSRPAAIPGEGALLELAGAAARGPVVIGQLGQTLDGRIATACGHSRYVNGAVALDHLHRLRAMVDAVIVGAGTLRDDDPALTVRRCTGANPVRVVLGGRRAIPRDRKLFTDGAAPTRIAGEDLASERCAEGLIDPRLVLDALAAEGFRVVLVEGGAATVSRFLAAGCLDRLHLLVAPTVLGSGRPGLVLQEVDTMDEVCRFDVARYALGEDLLFDLVPRRPSV